jgi:predicted metal-dependent HD superfamily phosphohydrolase
MSRDSSIRFMEAMWMEMVLSYGDHPKNTEAWLGNLIDAYTGPERFYHTTIHIATMLKDVHILSNREGITDPRMIEWATFWHDYYYVPGNPLNEQFSSEVAEKCLRDMGFMDFTVERVNELIMVTKNHNPRTVAECILSDADMLILAAPQYEYKEYARLLRLEYKDFSAEEWTEGRSDFIRKILKDGHIFHTETAKRFEQIARENLIWELDSLKRAVRN